jgi:hypothetical protein
MAVKLYLRLYLCRADLVPRGSFGAQSQAATVLSWSPAVTKRPWFFLPDHRIPGNEGKSHDLAIHRPVGVASDEFVIKPQGAVTHALFRKEGPDPGDRELRQLEPFFGVQAEGLAQGARQ